MPHHEFWRKWQCNGNPDFRKWQPPMTITMDYPPGLVGHLASPFATAVINEWQRRQPHDNRGRDHDRIEHELNSSAATHSALLNL